MWRWAHLSFGWTMTRNRTPQHSFPLFIAVLCFKNGFVLPAKCVPRLGTKATRDRPVRRSIYVCCVYYVICSNGIRVLKFAAGGHPIRHRNARIDCARCKTERVSHRTQWRYDHRRFPWVHIDGQPCRRVRVKLQVFNLGSYLERKDPAGFRPGR